jgi:hypothetical protein
MTHKPTPTMAELRQRTLDQHQAVIDRTARIAKSVATMIRRDGGTNGHVAAASITLPASTFDRLCETMTAVGKGNPRWDARKDRSASSRRSPCALCGITNVQVQADAGLTSTVRAGGDDHACAHPDDRIGRAGNRRISQGRTIDANDGGVIGHYSTDSQGTTTLYGRDGRSLASPLATPSSRR